METARLCKNCGEPLPSDAPEGICPKCLMKAGIGSECAGPSNARTTPDSASPAKPPPIDEIARHFPQLEIIALLGQGGMGVVYKARQLKLDRLVALKVLPRDFGRDPTFAERFSREAKTLAKLSHPGIVAVHDFGESEGLFYLTMEYIDGVNLREMELSKKLTPRQALEIVPKICDALQYAHDEGVVHRDIKPANILIDRKGRVKIADFGLAKLLGSSASDPTLTGSRHVMGTPHYMAPEQLHEPRTVDHRADIYSLGVVFYEMLTGELPVGRFEAPSERVRVDVRLDDIVLRTLERKPELRYQKVSEVKTDVETVSAGAEVSDSKRSSGPAEARARPAKRTIVPAPREEVKGPAIGLMVAGVINLAALLLPVAWMILRIVTGLFGGAAPPLGILEMMIVSVPGVLYAGSSVVIVIGARHLMDLRSHGWAVAACVLALLPFGPGWLIGLPMGVWGLVVLNRPGMRDAFDGGTAPAARTPVQDPASAPSLPVGVVPRTSGKAIAGALCALCFAFVVLVLFSSSRAATGPLGLNSVVAPNVAWRNGVLAVEQGYYGYGISRFFLPALLLVSVLAPIATMNLGFRAVRDIRTSQGTVTGLPLALFDAWLFPLLLLDALIIGSFVGVAGYGSRLVFGMGISLILPLLAGLVVSLVVDLIIVLLAWRAANRPVYQPRSRTA